MEALVTDTSGVTARRQGGSRFRELPNSRHRIAGYFGRMAWDSWHRSRPPRSWRDRSPRPSFRWLASRSWESCHHSPNGSPAADSHSRQSPGPTMPAARLDLALDAPSPHHPSHDGEEKGTVAVSLCERFLVTGERP